MFDKNSISDWLEKMLLEMTEINWQLVVDSVEGWLPLFRNLAADKEKKVVSNLTQPDNESLTTKQVFNLAKHTIRYFLRLIPPDNRVRENEALLRYFLRLIPPDNRVREDKNLCRYLAKVLGGKLLTREFFNSKLVFGSNEHVTSVAEMIAEQLFLELEKNPLAAIPYLQNYVCLLPVCVADSSVSKVFSDKLKEYCRPVLERVIQSENSKPVNYWNLIVIYQRLLPDSYLFSLVPLFSNFSGKDLIKNHILDDDSSSILGWIVKVFKRMANSAPWQIIERGLPIFVEVATEMKGAVKISLSSEDEKAEVRPHDEHFFSDMMRYFVELAGDDTLEINKDILAYLTDIFRPLMTPTLFNQEVNQGKNRQTYLSVMIAERIFKDNSSQLNTLLWLKRAFFPLLEMTDDKDARDKLVHKFNEHKYSMFARFIQDENTSLSDWFILSQAFSRLGASLKLFSTANVSCHINRVSELFEEDNWHVKLFGDNDWLSPEAHDLRISFYQALNLTQIVNGVFGGNKKQCEKLIHFAARQAVFLCFMGVIDDSIGNQREYLQKLVSNVPDDFIVIFCQAFSISANQLIRSLDTLTKKDRKDIAEKIKDMAKSFTGSQRVMRLLPLNMTDQPIESRKGKGVKYKKEKRKPLTDRSRDKIKRAPPAASVADVSPVGQLTKKSKQDVKKEGEGLLERVSNSPVISRTAPSPVVHAMLRHGLVNQPFLTVDISASIVAELKDESDFLQKIKSIDMAAKWFGKLLVDVHNSSDIDADIKKSVVGYSSRIYFYYLTMIFVILQQHQEIFNQNALADASASVWPYFELSARLEKLRHGGMHNPVWLTDTRVKELIAKYIMALHSAMPSWKGSGEEAGIDPHLDNSSPPITLDEILEKFQSNVEKSSVNIFSLNPVVGSDDDYKTSICFLIKKIKANFYILSSISEASRLYTVSTAVILFDIVELRELIKLDSELNVRLETKPALMFEIIGLRNPFAHIDLQEIKSIGPRIERIVTGLLDLFPDMVAQEETSDSITLVAQEEASESVTLVAQEETSESVTLQSNFRV